MAVVNVSPDLTASIGADVQGTPGAGDVPLVQLDDITIAWAPGGAVAAINAKTQYGAVGDGTTDDTAAIQAALNAVIAPGAIVYLPAGTYKVTSTLTVATAGTTIKGAGCGYRDATHAATTLSYTNGATPAITCAKDACRFADFALVCAAAGTPTAGAGIFLNSSKGTRIDAVVAKGFYDCFTLTNWYEGWLVNSSAWGPVRYGANLANPAVADGGDSTIYGCEFIAATYNGTAALKWVSGGGLRVENCKVNQSAAAFWVNGLDYEIAVGLSTGVLLVVGNSIENCTGVGISITDDVATLGEVVIGSNEILTTAAGTSAINITATALGRIVDVVIENNLLRGGSAGHAAITLVNVLQGNVGDSNSYAGGYGGLLATTGCKNISKPTAVLESIFSGAGDRQTTSTTFEDMTGLTLPLTSKVSEGDVLEPELNGSIYPSSTSAQSVDFCFVSADETVTVTIATPAVFSLVGHGLVAGEMVMFTTTGALPTGLTIGTIYFVIAAGLAADSFEVSATSGGAAVNTSGTQSGVHSMQRVKGQPARVSASGTANKITLIDYNTTHTVTAHAAATGTMDLRPRWRTSASTTFWANTFGISRGLFRVVNRGYRQP